MKSRLAAWTFLRPLLLAVAAAASWIALSAAGASADTSAPGDPLPGAGPSTLASATATLTHQAGVVLEPVESGPASAQATPSPVASPPLRPAVEDVTAVADDVVQAVPVVSTVVPAGAVSAVVDPAIGTVDGVAGETVGAVVPVAGAVLEPLAPVLEPVISAVPLPAPIAPPPTTTAPLPAGVDNPQAGAAPAGLAGLEVGAAGLEVGIPGTAPASAPPLHEIPLSHGKFHSNSLPCGPGMKPSAGRPLLTGADPQSPPSRGPDDLLPGVPGATGGSNLSRNGSAMPAWLDGQNLHMPAAGSTAVQGSLPPAPAPVSFYPGSFPD